PPPPAAPPPPVTTAPPEPMPPAATAPAMPPAVQVPAPPMQPASSTIAPSPFDTDWPGAVPVPAWAPQIHIGSTPPAPIPAAAPPVQPPGPPPAPPRAPPSAPLPPPRRCRPITATPPATPAVGSARPGGWSDGRAAGGSRVLVRNPAKARRREHHAPGSDQ